MELTRFVYRGKYKKIQKTKDLEYPVEVDLKTLDKEGIYSNFF